MTLGQKLKALLKDNSMTQEDLAPLSPPDRMRMVPLWQLI